MKTIGQNIARFRKEKGITQEQLSEICGVTPQAVSKWENDNSCPDVTLLKTIARAFGISVDELLDDGQGAVTKLSESKDYKGKLLKIRVTEEDEKVNINVPVSLIEILLKNVSVGKKISIGNSDALSAIDFNQVMDLISLGIIGKLMEVETSDGTIVEIWVE